MFKGRIYTTEEAAALLDGASKQRVSDIVRQHHIRYISGYDADAFDEYLYSRWRMILAREMGETVTGLVGHDDWDRLDNCPECGAFAIWKPANTDEVGDLGKPVYGEGWPWRCIKGHDSDE